MDISALSSKISLDEGEWVEEIPQLEGVRLLVRSTHYKPFQVATAGLARRSGKKLRTDEGAVQFSISAGKTLAEFILLDWDMSKAEGITAITSGGKPLKFSKENAVTLLTADDGLGIGTAWRQGVEWAGDRVAERIADRAKEAAGN